MCSFAVAPSQQPLHLFGHGRNLGLDGRNVGLEGRNYSGDGSFRQGMLVFSMGLPWVNAGKYRSEIARDQAKLKAAEYDLSDYELSVR